MSYSMDGTGEKTELSDEICNAHVSLDEDQYGRHSKSFYMCTGCLGMWPLRANMARKPHKKVVLKQEYQKDR